VLQLGDGAGLALEALLQVGRGGEVLRQDLDRDLAVEPRIAGAINFTHAARAGGRSDFVWAKPGSGVQRHECPRLAWKGQRAQTRWAPGEKCMTIFRKPYKGFRSFTDPSGNPISSREMAERVLKHLAEGAERDGTPLNFEEKQWLLEEGGVPPNTIRKLDRIIRRHFPPLTEDQVHVSDARPEQSLEAASAEHDPFWPNILELTNAARHNTRHRFSPWWPRNFREFWHFVKWVLYVALIVLFILRMIQG
jgi:hypothetical protein